MTGVMESHFGLFGDSVSFSARWVPSLRIMHYSLRNHFGRTCRYYKAKRLKWKLSFVCLEIVLILIQDRIHGLQGTYYMLGNKFGRTRWSY